MLQADNGYVALCLLVTMGLAYSTKSSIKTGHAPGGQIDWTLIVPVKKIPLTNESTVEPLLKDPQRKRDNLLIKDTSKCRTRRMCLYHHRKKV